MSLLQLTFTTSWKEKKGLIGIVITEHHQLQDMSNNSETPGGKRKPEQLSGGATWKQYQDITWK